ncbi:MAG: head-tail adaptor protein [Jannaschia sp.]
MAKVFTRRLIHQVPIQIADGGGGYVETWEVRGAHWCEVRMRSGALKETEFGLTPRLQVRITTRGIPQSHEARPWPGHRMLDAARIFSVEAVQEADGEDRYLTILATEVTSDQVPS